MRFAPKPINSFMRLFYLFSLMTLTWLSDAPAQTAAPTPDRWQNIRFLFGDWEAPGQGATGASQGSFSFHPQLGDQIVVRQNQADYGKNKRHEDLLVIYAETQDQPLHAIYFDSEGHVIRYHVTATPKTVVFDSETDQPGPRYRLSYALVDESLHGKFEIAPPNSQEYKAYLTWTATKK
jgi:hypothetical protein